MHPTWFKNADGICHDMENSSALEERRRSDCGAWYTGRYCNLSFGAFHCNLALNQHSRTINDICDRKKPTRDKPGEGLISVLRISESSSP